MKRTCRYVALVVAALLIGTFVDRAAFGQLAPNAPKDQPKKITQKQQLARLDDAIAPYVSAAKKTYPDARARFNSGLPRGEHLYVTTRLIDSNGVFEQAFIQVKTIADGQIAGTIATRLTIVTEFKAGQSYTLPEKDLLDWLISKPDGSEEGNVVGKFLDTYRP